ncbi:malate synthase-like [Ptychodera flava]|uniref:malate synthase-like n=1 Tax=Ptychodera flava TaxID=63121 RepID=UPI00396AA49B
MSTKAARRLLRLQSHLPNTNITARHRPSETASVELCVTVADGTTRGENVGQADELASSLKRLGITDVEVRAPPTGLENEYRTILTADAVTFVADLVRHFNSDVQKMLTARVVRKAELDTRGSLPDFSEDTIHIRESSWTVRPVPPRLQNRHIDLGDVSPSNQEHFLKALKSKAQCIQVDFDDGHCPTWRNQLCGMYHIHRFVHGRYQDVPAPRQAPVLMLRPRAWNMVDHTMMVHGIEVPGPLWDFGLMIYHFGKVLLQCESGPFFYLSKLEGYKEARLWNEIFVWSEQRLGLPHGCMKACVLIENLLSSFEMHEILYELRDHSAGLNCGIWDYSASFINKFGHRADFLLPDRNKYVNMEKHFLKSYMDLVIQTCHKRGCHATGGMSALLVPDKNLSNYHDVIQKTTSAKLKEIQAGVDGFLVYDDKLIEPMQKLFEEYAPSDNQYNIKRLDVQVTPKDLLLMPKGGVTFEGLKHNIAVGILFIDAWFHGKGHFFYKGAVEDSATAEISRSQVWQWIRHQARLEDDGKLITYQLVADLVVVFINSQMQTSNYATLADRKHLRTASEIFLEIVAKRDFPEFITTYLNLEHAFLKGMH